MRCPFCGKEMQQGKLRTRGENYFIPNGNKTPMLYTKKSMDKAGAILVSPDCVVQTMRQTGKQLFYARNAEKLLQTFEMVQDFNFGKFQLYNIIERKRQCS